MKMKFLLAVTLLAGLTFSCSNDDDGNNNVAVEGTWKLTAFNIESSIDLNGDGTASSDLLEETNCYQNEIIEFNADNSATVKSTSYLDMEGQYDANTGAFEIITNCVSEIENLAGTWAQAGGTVTVTVNGQPVVFTQAGSVLTATVPAGYEVPTDDNGTVAYVSEELTIQYTKQ